LTQGGAWIDVKGACHRITFNGKGAVLIVIEDARTGNKVVGNRSFDLAAEAIAHPTCNIASSFGRRRGGCMARSAAEAIGADARHLFKDDHTLSPLSPAPCSSMTAGTPGLATQERWWNCDGQHALVSDSRSEWASVSILIVDTDSAEVKSSAAFLRAQRCTPSGTLAAGIARSQQHSFAHSHPHRPDCRISDDAGTQR
jgi:hypothetical protein